MKLEALQQCLNCHPEIVAAYLIGSALSGKMTPTSDIDVALVVGDDMADHDVPLLARKLAQEVRKLFGCEGDVKVLNCIHKLPFLHDVLANGKLLVEREPEIHRRFVRRVLTAHLDFQPVYEQCLRTYARSFQRV